MSTSLPPAPSGLIARYYGDPGGSNTYYYWVQAIYASSRSDFVVVGPITAAGLASGRNFVAVSWNAMPDAIAYDVLRTTTSTKPIGTATIAADVNESANNFTDVGNALIPYTVGYGSVGTSGSMLRVAHARYSFAADGGAISTITPSITDTIPDNAILLGGTVNVTTAGAGAGGTLAIGTSAGSSTTAILAATAVASLTTDALINVVPVFATPVKMTAAGVITFTIATTAFTAGIVEVFVLYVIPGA